MLDLQAAGNLAHLHHAAFHFHFMNLEASRLRQGDPAAMAAELRHSIPDYQAPAPLYDWTGFHIGAHVSKTSFSVNGSAVNGATGMPVAPGTIGPSDWHGGMSTTARLVRSG